METNSLKWTRLQNEIFNYLCIKAGNSVNQNEIANALNVSPSAISKALKIFTKDELIIYKKSSRMNLISIELNRDNQIVIPLKRIQNLKSLYESGIVKLLEHQFPGTQIILFGSYSYGTDTLGSDIDIAIIGSKTKELKLEQFEKLFEREIILQFYDSLQSIHKNLKNSLLNGVILKGVIEYE